MKFLRSLLPDFISLVGLGLLGYGLYLYIPWISFAVVGSLLVIGGALMARRE